MANQSARLALVVGNAEYQFGRPLRNTKNDAVAISAALSDLGLTSHIRDETGRFEKLSPNFNQSLMGMNRLLADFHVEAQASEMAVIYFSGHGIEIDAQNHLIPVDAQLGHVVRVRFETVHLSDVTDAVAGASRLRFVMLDACRDNPFAHTMKGLDAGKSVRAGLGPANSRRAMIFYAAAAGHVAKEGKDGGLSPFAAALIANLRVPGCGLYSIIGAVTEDVQSATQGAQEPTLYGTMVRDIVFKSNAAVSDAESIETGVSQSKQNAPVEKKIVAPPQTDVRVEEKATALPPTEVDVEKKVADRSPMATVVEKILADLPPAKVHVDNVADWHPINAPALTKIPDVENEIRQAKRGAPLEKRTEASLSTNAHIDEIPPGLNSDNRDTEVPTKFWKKAIPAGIACLVVATALYIANRGGDTSSKIPGFVRPIISTGPSVSNEAWKDRPDRAHCFQTDLAAVWSTPTRSFLARCYQTREPCDKVKNDQRGRVTDCAWATGLLRSQQWQSSEGGGYLNSWYKHSNAPFPPPFPQW